MKPNPIEKKATSSSSWQEDPRTLTDLPEVQQSSVLEYRRHWHQIRTRFNRQNRLLDWYNYRLSSPQPQEVIQHLDEIFTDQSTVFKLNVSFGFILRNNETGALQYYYASRNNEQVFEAPFQITTADDLPHVREALQNLDVLAWVRQHRPNSKWVVQQVTTITFVVTKLQGHPIGRGQSLPHYIVENRGIDAMDRNYRTGKIYSDNLCFFRALALHNGCHPKNLERDAQHYCERYKESFPEKKKFCGVKLKELIDLEHLYEVNIFVYSLEPTKPDGEEGEEDIEKEEEDFAPEIAAHLIHRSLCHYPSTLHLNLYQDSDDEGEDLMDTDDEEEEDIESETEEDRAFLDDKVESEQGASFYRALDRERENQSENDHECEFHRPEDNSPEPKEKKVHPLKKLCLDKYTS